MTIPKPPKENPAEASIAQHYATENLTERILASFEGSGKRRDHLTIEELSAVDEFHIGGREATEALAAQMNLRSGMRLLDIGSGIGGPARYFASVHGCRVTGIDLTGEYVRTARALSKLVGMSAVVQFERGSATDLPFEPQSFDGAYMFHVGMNVRDKAKLFLEVKRVLQPGSIFAIYDVMRTGSGEMPYPLPWASKESESFLATIEDYRQGLTQQGFAISAMRQRREFAIGFLERLRLPNQQGGLGPQGIHLIMGESAKVKTGNVLDRLRQGIIAPVEMLART